MIKKIINRILVKIFIKISLYFLLKRNITSRIFRINTSSRIGKSLFIQTMVKELSKKNEILVLLPNERERERYFDIFNSQKIDIKKIYCTSVKNMRYKLRRMNKFDFIFIDEINFRNYDYAFLSYLFNTNSKYKILISLYSEYQND